MPCIICGDSDTIEAHLVPRSLYRTLAGDAQHGVSGNRFRVGIRYQAKGTFDRNLLCRRHEDAFRLCDNYSVPFIRTFQTAGRETLGGRLWEVPNPKPDLLVRFMAGCVWRRAMSPVGTSGADLSLGRWEAPLRAYLFDGTTDYVPRLMLYRRRIRSQSVPLDGLMWEPYKDATWGDDAWSFMALGCHFTLQLSPYSRGQFPPYLIANNRDPVRCVNRVPEEISRVEGMLDIGVNMLRGDPDSPYYVGRQKARKT